MGGETRSIGGVRFEGLERRLGVRRQGQADGAAERPASDARDPAAMERDIAAAVEAARARLAAERRALAGPAERAARRAEAAAAGGGLDPTFAEARLSLRLAERRYAAEVASARRASVRAAADLDGFRRAHNLRRPAVYPASAILAGGLLFLAAAVEAMFSAALFDADVEGGLLAAAAVAGGLGGANVAAGFLAGFLGLRYLQHRDLAPRLGGVAALVAAFTLAAGLSLFAADWRDRIQAETAFAETEAARLDADAKREACLAAIRNDREAALDDARYSAREARCRARHAAPARDGEPASRWSLGFASPEAVVLLMLAAGVWAFAALKGYSGVDDPYPDYGKLDRAAHRLEDALAARRDEAREALEEALDAARDAHDDARAARRASLAEAEMAFDAAAKAIEPLSAEERQLDRDEAALIALYRAENARRRATPAPAFFAEPPPPRPRDDALAEAGAALVAARAAHAAAEARAAAALEELSHALDAAMTRLEGGEPAPA